MAVPLISALPTPPNRQNAPEVLISNADAFFGAMPTLRTEMNAAIAALNAGDYTAPDEGSWTATLSDSSGNNSATTVTGTYYAMGDMVLARFQNMNNISTAGLTAGNQIRLSLPFTVATGYSATGIIDISSLASLAGTGTTVLVTGSAGTNYAVIRSSYATGPASTMTVAALSSGVSDIVLFQMLFVRA